MSDRSFLFLLGSSRANGNTEALARRAAETLPAQYRRRWLRLADHPLDPFVDTRHVDGGVYRRPVGNAGVLLDATLEATDLVIASPLYWYSVSASTKLYLDHWAGWFRVPGLEFRAAMRGRTMWAISAISEQDPATADPLLGTLRTTATYMGMHWGGHLLGYANRPGDVESDQRAQAAARELFTSGCRAALPRPSRGTPAARP